LSHKKAKNSVNIVASLLGYAVPLLVNFASTPYLVRSLGEDAFGVQVLVNVVIGYLALMDLGIGLPLIKYLAEDRAKGDTKAEAELLSTTLVLYIVLGVLGMLVAFSLSSYLAEHFFTIPESLQDTSTTVFQLAGAGFFATLLMGWGRSVAMGLQRYDIAYAISALSSVLGVGVGVLAVYSGYGLEGYVFSKVLFLFAAAIIYFVTFYFYMSSIKISLRPTKEAFSRIRSYLVYGIVHRGITGLAGSIDKTLLGILISSASVGLYSLPYMITNSISYALSFTLSFVFPASSELYATGQYEQLKSLFVNSSRFLVALSCMTFAPLFLFGDMFLYLWIGPEITEKVLPTFYVLAIAAFIKVTLTSLINNVMMGIGRVDQFTVYTVIRVFVFTFFCAVLIPYFGFDGAALGVLLACMVDFFYFLWALKVHLKLNYSNVLSISFVRPIFIVITVGVLFFPFSHPEPSWLNMLILTLVVEFVVVILYYKLNVFREREKELIRNIFVRFSGRSE